MDTKSATEYYLTSFRKYADFTGRAVRSEYWYFVLFNFIISIALSYFDRLFGSGSTFGSGILSIIFSLGILLPGIAVAVRRLHDIGKSGLWILLAFIPIIGWIWLIVLYISESAPGDNEYGPNQGGSSGTQPPTSPTPPPQSNPPSQSTPLTQTTPPDQPTN